MKYLLSILFYYFLITPIFAQDATNWQNYTDMKTVRSLISDNNGIWAATSGGAFFYNAVKDTFNTFHKADGLTGSSLSAVTIDRDGKIWFGSTDGIINVYNPSKKNFQTILDIANTDHDTKSINDLETSGDTIFVGTDFGISLINSKTLLFYDSFSRFGSFSSNIPVNSISKFNLIYVCTNSGVAIQKAGSINLSAPESWNDYTTSNGLPSNTVYRIAKYKNAIIAATSNGLSEFNGSQWVPFLSQFNGKNIKDISVHNDTLLILADNNIDLYYNGKLTTEYSSSTTLNHVLYSPKMGILSASDRGIVSISSSHKVSILAPNCPYANQFPSLVVDNNNVLWSASGSDPNGKGFYKFNGKVWTNYNRSNTPQFNTNNYFTVYASPDNTIYFGNWGDGFARIKKGSIQIFDTKNTGMTGIANNSDYLVISGFATDSQNNLWILNFGPANRKPLAMLTSDSTWYFYSVPSTGNLNLDEYHFLVVDQYDTKWFACQSPDRSGLFYFNENKTPDNPNDDISGYLTTASGLNSNRITSLAVDRRGDIWVGTNLGVNIISSTYTITQNTTPQLSITSVFSLRQQTINCIAVDPLNRKWIGTNQGLLLVNSDGSSLLDAYNTSNSPLLSDQITSVAVDDNNGTVYVGSDKGITSFKTAAIKPVDGFTKLFMYPSPFVLNSNNNKLTIDGLVRDSQIKILTISGKLVTAFSSPGGRIAYWDGRDENGNLVNTGIYIIVASDKEGNNVITGKIAVLQQ